jgi:hypothetical protein
MLGVGAADIIGEIGLAISSRLTAFDLSRFTDQDAMASGGIGKAARRVVLLPIEGISRCQTSRRRRRSGDRIGVVCADGQVTELASCAPAEVLRRACFTTSTHPSRFNSRRSTR